MTVLICTVGMENASTGVSTHCTDLALDGVTRFQTRKCSIGYYQVAAC